MSKDSKIIALGSVDFVLPYGMAGLRFKVITQQDEAIDFIYRENLETTLFILDEDIISDIKEIEEAEEAGGNILILKGWGKSLIAKDKIRNAGILAIGVDMEKEKK